MLGLSYDLVAFALYTLVIVGALIALAGCWRKSRPWALGALAVVLFGGSADAGPICNAIAAVREARAEARAVRQEARQTKAVTATTSCQATATRSQSCPCPQPQAETVTTACTFPPAGPVLTHLPTFPADAIKLSKPLPTAPRLLPPSVFGAKDCPNGKCPLAK